MIRGFGRRACGNGRVYYDLKGHFTRMKIWLLLPPTIALALAASAPASQPDVERKGRDLLERALADLGGRAALERIRYWHTVANGRENLSADLQGLRPGRATWRVHDETVGIDADTLTTSWERKSARNDHSFRWRRIVMSAEGTSFYDWVTHQRGMGSTPAPEPRRRAMVRRVPHLLLLEAVLAPKVSWKQMTRMEEGASDEVVVTTRDGSELTLSIAQASPRVVRAVEFRGDLPGAGTVPVVWHWRHWRPHAELGAIPSGQTITIDGVPFQEVAFATFGGSSRRPSVLGMPAPPAQDHVSTFTATSPTSLPATGEVRPGVHVFDVGGFVVMAVEFRDFLVAVEAPAVHPGFEGIPARPGTTQVSADVLAAIGKAVPSKPIRFVVLSHHHSDHLGGAGLFARIGATMLVAPGDRAAVARAVAATSDRPARIETVGRRRTISDGSRSIEILNTGPNPHTAENLVVWLPAERVVFQGDLFYYAIGQPFPPSGRAAINRFFAEWLQKQALEPDAVYGVHSAGAAGPALLELALRGSGGR